MNLLEIFFCFGFGVYLFYTSQYLELFQRKEYRLDRVRAYIDDFGLTALLLPIYEFRRPKLKHPRNILILLIILATLTIEFALLKFSMLWSSIFLVFAPFSAMLNLLIGVLLSSIPVNIYRFIMIEAAKIQIQKYQPIVIGVTGSYGKSTTKDYIAAVLSKKFDVTSTPKNTNTDIGIAQTIINRIKKNGLVFVVEMGAYKKGEIQRICDIVHPQYAVITAFGTQHAGIFGGRKEIVKAKCELAISIPQDGAVYLTSTDYEKIPHNILAHIKAPIKKYKYIADNPHLQAIQATTNVASNMGMTYEEIQVAIESLPFPQNTKIRKHLKKKYEYLLSTYSTNTESFISHINALYHMKKSHQAILTPGIIELGKERKSEYQRIVSEIKNETYIFTTDPNFAKACTSNKTQHVTYDANQINLFRKAKSILNEDFALLIEGRFRQSCIDSIV